MTIAHEAKWLHCPHRILGYRLRLFHCTHNQAIIHYVACQKTHSQRYEQKRFCLWMKHCYPSAQWQMWPVAGWLCGMWMSRWWTILGGGGTAAAKRRQGGALCGCKNSFGWQNGMAKVWLGRNIEKKSEK